MSPPTYFPLRWESTGDQWWYASPIDWAAANGHYDLVRELLRLDANHLIKLTSLRRIRRLETVWDDDAAAGFHHVARCRSAVARKLLAECDVNNNNNGKNYLSNKNSLIGGGYGGWLLYTAASAGDAAFVGELLERDPLLVFGEGEYGVTDILYAAARSGDSGVFKMVLDFAAAPRFGGAAGEGEVPAGYRVEIMNRAIHAAARGGNVGLVKELLRDCSDDALAYRDVQGATLLHAAAARGQVQVVRELGSSWGLIDATDKQGNTALHVAAQRGHLAAVEALIEASPSSITATNHAGDTFLHSVVAGFQTPGFRRLDRQMELMRHLLSGQLFPVEAIINSTNSQGKTPLHLAIASNTHSDLVELLMAVPSIDVNVRDGEGATPLDILRRRPACPSSDLLARRLVSAGGVLTSRDYSARRAIASHIKRQSMGSSPGTSFRISDGEIFLYTATPEAAPGTTSSCSPEPVPAAGAAAKAAAPAAPTAAQRLRRLLHWPKAGKEKAKKPAEEETVAAVPLRQRFSNAKASTSNSNSNKRSLSVRSREASPGAKKKMAAGVMHGVMRAVPAAAGSRRSRSSSLSKLSFSSLSSNEEGGKRAAAAVGNRRSSVMNQYLCFGGPTQGVEPAAAAAAAEPYDLYERSVLAAA